MTEQLDTEPVYIQIPLEHLGHIVAAYLKAIEVVDKDDVITSVNIPVQTDDENLITCRVGIIKKGKLN